MDGRIDKVEILLMGDGWEWRTQLEEYTHWCELEAEEQKITRKVCSEAKHYNPQLGLWQHYFQVWGPVADAFLQWLHPSSYGEIYRLDYRIELQGKTPSFKLVADTMMARDPNMQHTTMYQQSPYRTKRGGRGVGGPTVSSGASESDIQLSMYDRYKEGAVLELQLQGNRLRNLISTARNSFHALQVETLYWHTIHHMAELMEKVSEERIGCGTEGLQNGNWWQQGTFQDVQEVLQFECISSYNQLDWDHQNNVLGELQLMPYERGGLDE